MRCESTSHLLNHILLLIFVLMFCLRLLAWRIGVYIPSFFFNVTSKTCLFEGKSLYIIDISSFISCLDGNVNTPIERERLS